MKAYIITEQEINDIKYYLLQKDSIKIDDVLENLNELPIPKKLDLSHNIPEDFYTNRAKYFVKLELNEDRTEFSKFIEENNFIKPGQPYYIKDGVVFDYGDLRELF